MELKELQNHIRTLALLEQTHAVVMSCYLNLEKGGVANRDFFQKRVNLLREATAEPKLNGFEDAVTRIGEYLDTERLADSGGVAVFARGGEEPFFLPLQFKVPLPDWVAVGPFANIFHLVELKDTYHRFVILISTEEKARILEVTLGEVTAELIRERPELRERMSRGWSKERYQRRRQNRDERFVKEKIEVLEDLMKQGGHKHFILAGNPRLTAEIGRSLPIDLRSKLVDTVTASGADQLADIVKMAITMFTEEEERESRAVVEKLMEEVNTNCLGVAGVTKTLRSLRSGTVDILVIAKDFEDANMREEMIRLAAKSACRVEVVNHSDSLMQFDGVGALLRFYAPEQYFK